MADKAAADLPRQRRRRGVLLAFLVLVWACVSAVWGKEAPSTQPIGKRACTGLCGAL